MTVTVTQTNSSPVVVRTTSAGVVVTAPTPTSKVVVSPAGSAGPQGPAGPPGGNYVYNQGAPAATWVITHNLGFYPSITVIDSGGSVVEGDIVHDSVNQVTLTFGGASFSGTAYLS